MHKGHAVPFAFQESVLKELKLYDNTEQAPSYLQRDANDERSLRLLPSSFTTEQTFSVSITYPAPEVLHTYDSLDCLN